MLAVGAFAFALVIVGIMLAGPWLTAKLAAVMARAARRPPLLLAARRLHDNPSAGFRSISGLVVAAFVTSVFSGLTPAVVGQANTNAAQTSGNRLFASLARSTGNATPSVGQAALAGSTVDLALALPAGRAATLLRTLTNTPRGGPRGRVPDGSRRSGAGL